MSKPHKGGCTCKPVLVPTWSVCLEYPAKKGEWKSAEIKAKYSRLASVNEAKANSDWRKELDHPIHWGVVGFDQGCAFCDFRKTRF